MDTSLGKVDTTPPPGSVKRGTNLPNYSLTQFMASMTDIVTKYLARLCLLPP